MPLLPIDLQTMFSQMNQVGREQAVQREVAPQYQFAQGAEIARKTEHDDSAVNQSQDLGEGLEKLKERGEREARRREEREKRGAGRDGSRDREIFEDPDLGHHIDITG